MILDALKLRFESISVQNENSSEDEFCNYQFKEFEYFHSFFLFCMYKSGPGVPSIILLISVLSGICHVHYMISAT